MGRVIWRILSVLPCSENVIPFGQNAFLRKRILPRLMHVVYNYELKTTPRLLLLQIRFLDPWNDSKVYFKETRIKRYTPLFRVVGVGTGKCVPFCNKPVLCQFHVFPSSHLTGQTQTSTLKDSDKYLSIPTSTHIFHQHVSQNGEFCHELARTSTNSFPIIGALLKKENNGKYKFVIFVIEWAMLRIGIPGMLRRVRCSTAMTDAELNYNELQ